MISRAFEQDVKEYNTSPVELKDCYASLRNVFRMAEEQASMGKGKNRHAVDGELFQDQQICEISRRIGIGFSLGQAVKKIYESDRLDKDASISELLGAINYIAAAIIVKGE